MQENNHDQRFAALEAKLAEQGQLIAAQNVQIAQLRLSRTQQAIRLLRTKRRLITATLVCFVGIPLLHAAVPHTFTAGTAAVAADVNANLTYLDEISVPVGGIIGWHKSFANVPALPASGKWVECNGQVLADAGSVLNNQTIPNRNGVAGRKRRATGYYPWTRQMVVSAIRRRTALQNPAYECQKCHARSFDLAWHFF